MSSMLGRGMSEYYNYLKARNVVSDVMRADIYRTYDGCRTMTQKIFLIEFKNNKFAYFSAYSFYGSYC